MGDHFCQYIVDFDPDPEESVLCDKPASIKLDDGWFCADHFDKLEAAQQRWKQYETRPVCSVCNYEFYNGECNCDYDGAGADLELNSKNTTFAFVYGDRGMKTYRR